MVPRQLVYTLGVFNLILACVAIFCVVQAEVYPEYFSLIYITVGVFAFYIGTIILILILQIIETCKQHLKKTRLLSDTQIPSLTTDTSITSDSKITETNEIQQQPIQYLCRSHTLPIVLTPSSSTRSSSLNLKRSQNKSNQILMKSNSSKVLPKYKKALAPIHKNYQSISSGTNSRCYFS